jgi:hypothetical protein
MKQNLTRTNIVQRLRSTFADPAAIMANITDSAMPRDLESWLSRLALLYGVPFNYLVPDEKMLPPESIRFFYLDENWIGALTDGAFSIGRNLTEDNTAAYNLDKAVQAGAMQQVRKAMPNVRAKILGLPAPPPPAVITGFLLRSSIVQAYPTLGVYAYPLNGTPNDPKPVMLDILRFERLGSHSDTMICLVSGDAYRVDIHESPQALHYGIDCYNDNCEVNGVKATAVKNLYTFTISDTVAANGTTTQTVKMSDTPTPADISSCIRSNNTRTLDISTLAGIIASKNNISSIDSAEMGFEMTEGVGMVSFYKTT